MNHLKVIAFNITNLTDARYFAARGADYLFFDLALVSVDKVLEFQSWVEGPQTIILFNDETLDEIEKILISLQPSHFGSRDPNIDIGHLEPHFSSIQLSKDGDALVVKLGSQNFHFFSGKASSLQDFITNTGAQGLLLPGQTEESVGLIDYDEMDKVFEILGT